MLTDFQLPEYLDAAATTPVHPEVLEAMLPYFTQHFGNANSQHIYGQIAKKAIDDARESIAAHINVLPEEIIFTSGATEAINLAIKGYWEANRDKGNHIITVKTEHKAVLNTCAYLDVDHYGRITNDQLRAAFRPDTILACVMHVNNETGLIQDVHSFAETCAEQGIAFFTDSTQAVGHIETDYSNPAITMACMSAHKIRGPKGIGILVKKTTIVIAPILHGGQTSNVLEPGTAPTSLIIGLNAALELSKKLTHPITELSEVIQRLNHTFNPIEFKPLIPDQLRSPHILSLVSTCTFTEEQLLNAMSTLSMSTGSACNSATLTNSHVIEALQIPSFRTLRTSFFYNES